MIYLNQIMFYGFIEKENIMKRLLALVMFMAFLVMPISVDADCSFYNDELINQCFTTDAEGTMFTVCFGESVYGPCPCGTVVLSYTYIQVIDDIEYETFIEIDLNYSATANIVTIEGLNFILSGGKLILLPEDLWIFDIVEEEIESGK